MVEERINDPINFLDGSYSIMLVPSSNLALQNIVGILTVEKCSPTVFLYPRYYSYTFEKPCYLLLSYSLKYIPEQGSTSLLEKPPSSKVLGHQG